jgi:hypothetical protein
MRKRSAEPSAESRELAASLSKPEQPDQEKTILSAGKEEALAPAFVKITETIFVEDPLAVYERLERGLKLGEGRVDHATVLKAIDEAEENARLANKLLQTTSLEVRRWKMENAIVHAAMRTQAHASLQREKDAGQRNKTITDADIENRMAAIFGDEWKVQEVGKARAEAMESSIKNLAEMWVSRCKTLQTIYSKTR